MKKYNKFFSYKNTERLGKNFFYKDFSYSDSKNTNFLKSKFYGNCFYRAKMKFCGFNDCEFEFIEFDNVNFTGSRFKGAKFKNVVFRNCNLSKTIFTNAVFSNVYFENTALVKVSSLITNNSRQLDEKPNLEISEELFAKLECCKKNIFILNSKTIFYKKKGYWTKAMKDYAKTLSKAERKNFQREEQSIDKPAEYKLKFSTIQLLLNCFTEKEIIDGLEFAIRDINKPFVSIGYLAMYINKCKIIT